ncbi:MAG: hypothetical protein R6W69_04475, partial [Anaerolineales bacterium]
MPFLPRLSFALFFSVILLGVGTLHAAAQAEPLDEADYWQLVQESRVFLDRLIQDGLEDSLDAPSRARLETLATRWENVRQVRLDNGTVMRMDGLPWARLLRANPPNLPRLHELFLTLEHERQLETAQGFSTDGLESLQDILARPEYQWREETPSWLQILWEKFLEWLSEFAGESQSVSVSSGRADVAIDIMNILAFVVIAAILAYAIKTMFSDFISEAALEANGQHDAPLNARQALKQADSFSQVGDYRTAVRYLYLSALLILDERGLLYY